MATLYLSLGTNLGDRQKNLSSALDYIGREVGTIESESDVMETEPWGFESSNRFLNMVVKVETGLPPLEVLHATQEIERKLGRTQKSVDREYHDRLIDIDILLYDNLVVNTPELTIPHPLMYQREFVMKPLAQIAPELAMQWLLLTMADNYLEKHYEDYLKRKAAWEKSRRHSINRGSSVPERPDDEALWRVSQT